LVGTVLLTGLAAFSTQRSAREKDRFRFDSSVQRTQASIHQRLDTYIALLEAGSGLFTVSNSSELGSLNRRVSRADFRKYIEQQHLRERFPGVQGIGFSQRFLASEKAALLAEMKQQGIKNFAVKPNGSRSEYHAILYLEPLDRRNQSAIGYDMFTEARRRAAMERARDTGQPSATGRVTLIQETEQHKQTGFLIYVPVYQNGAPLTTVAQRRAALQGFVYGPFRTDDLMAGIFAKGQLQYVDFQLYDGTRLNPTQLLYRSKNAQSDGSYTPQFTKTVTFSVAGRPWSLVFTSRPELDSVSHQSFVPPILGTGILVSLVLFLLTRSQVKSLLKAEDAAIALQRNNERLALLYSMSSSLLLHEQPKVFIASLFSQLSQQLDLEVYLNYLLDAKQQTLRLNASSGLSQSMLQHIEVLEVGESISGRVAQQKQRVVVERVSQTADTEVLRSQGLTAYACYPLIARHQLIGTLAFGSRDRSVFTPDELTLLQVVCDQVAAAIERAALVDQLRQQTEDLREASRLKDEFLATLSHELRTPMNAMLGWTSLLRSRKFDAATTLRALETIERNTKSLNQLIEDLLDVSRIVTGKLRLHRHPVELVPIVNAAIEMVRSSADAKKIHIQTTLEPLESPVLGDATRLQQVIWNLMTNAIKFTPPEGHVEVQLTRVPRSPSSRVESYAQIQVIDTGAGISPEFLPYVFDRFRQADSKSTRLHGGLGLGLAIVHHLIESHGGTVLVESPGEGQGSTFTVQLPLLNQLNQSVRPARDVYPTGSIKAMPRLDGIRVLVVDDEADAREIAATSLQQAGAEVMTASTAGQALDTFLNFNPQVLIGDIGMPEEDGYSLIKKVRLFEASRSESLEASQQLLSAQPSMKETRQIPTIHAKTCKAIALTAFASADDRERILKSGFQQHLAKPIQADELIYAVATVLDP
jgi:signal transduction histidine kinase/CHASE1-domain containing sensor protein/DNA-binding NarL/FixJ family response regulator